MVKLNKIYTKTGDDGTTALAAGGRRAKYDLRVAAYGTVDETNAAIGLVRLETAGQKLIDVMLMRIQNDCFDLGADLATPKISGESEEPATALRIVESQIERLEQNIDELNEELEPLRSFVLPGGVKAAAHLHLARTIARRAERLVVELAENKQENINPLAQKYLNRLSDFLFVAARYVNNKGALDVLWQPGEYR